MVGLLRTKGAIKTMCGPKLITIDAKSGREVNKHSLARHHAEEFRWIYTARLQGVT